MFVPVRNCPASPGPVQSSWKLQGDKKSQEVAVPWHWPWAGAGALCAQLNSEHSLSQLVCQSKPCSAFCCQGMGTPVPGAAPRGPCSLPGHRELLPFLQCHSCQLSTSVCALDGQPLTKPAVIFSPGAEGVPLSQGYSLPL